LFVWGERKRGRVRRGGGGREDGEGRREGATQEAVQKEDWMVGRLA